MLHNIFLKTMQNCSKGARGLSVQPQYFRIFTKNPISSSQYQRQQGSRYTIHARQNLPDKEFRYLRTVMVTAAVYCRLYSALARLLFASQHLAGVRPYTSFYNLAKSCVFNKQSLPSIKCHLRFNAVLFFPKLQR